MFRPQYLNPSSDASGQVAGGQEPHGLAVGGLVDGQEEVGGPDLVELPYHVSSLRVNVASVPAWVNNMVNPV